MDWVMGKVEYFESYLYCPVTFRATETKAQSRISAGSYSSTCPKMTSFSDAFFRLYMRVCPSVHPSAGRLFSPSVTHKLNF